MVMLTASFYYLKVSVLFFVICLFYYLVKYWRLWQKLRKIPGPTPLPLIGNALLFSQDPVERFFQLRNLLEEYKKFGVFRLLIGSQVIIIILKAEHLVTIFGSSEHIDKSLEYNFLHPWLGTGLLTSTGEKWRYRRRLLTPVFHFQIMQDFLDVFCEQSEILVSQLRTHVDHEQFNIYKYITLCVLDIICEAAMGKKLSAQTQSECEYVKAVYELSEIIFHRMFKPWLKFDFLFYLIGNGREHDRYLKILHKFTDEVIRERSEQFKHQQSNGYADNSKQKKRLAFLDLLLESAKSEGTLSPLDIREEVDTFMFEGHDTTASGISWTIYLIGCYPEIQQRLHEEMDTIFEGSSRKPTMEDVKNMKYLDCVIKEALRVFPSVPFIGRHIKEDIDLGGYQIPKSSTIMVGVYGVHRDADYFPDPEEFKPERFEIENTANRHPFAYVPFSAGSRNCIGQKFAMLEEKVVLSYILRNFHIESMQKREDLILFAQLILRPCEGIYITLKERH